MNITFSPKTADACVKAFLPVVGQNLTTVAIAAGTTPVTAITAATGTTPFSEVLVSNPGCAPLRVTASVLVGSDCDTCTVDAITVQTLVVDVPGFVDSFQLPVALYTNIEYVTLDTVGGAPTANAKEQKVFVYGVGTGQCAECAVLVP